MILYVQLCVCYCVYDIYYTVYAVSLLAYILY